MHAVRLQISVLTPVWHAWSVIFCALICTDTEAASGIVIASDKALKVCVW